MKEWPQLVGRSFGEVLVMFPAAIPLGIRRPDGLHMINPDDDYCVQKGITISRCIRSYTELLQPLGCTRIFRSGTCLEISAG